MSKKPPQAEPHQARVPEIIVLPPQQADDEPYTTSEIIAEGTGINHRRIRDAIRKYKTDLETFGKVGAYQTTFPGSKTRQTIPCYILNEQQATFLMTLLKNTSIVVAFKRELVRQFYEMRERLRNGAVWEEYEEPEEDEELYSENCGPGAYLADRKVTEAQMLAARRASERRMERHKARLRELLDHL